MNNAGQYQTQIIEKLSIQKGITFKHPISTNIDLKGCLLFGEIRRRQPGRLLVDSYTVSMTEGERRVIVNAPREDSDLEILKSLNIREKDVVSIIGAGIKNATVEAVSGRALFVDQVAQRTLSETRMTVKAPVLASFTFVPKSDLYKILVTKTSEKEAANLSVSQSLIKSGDSFLVFNYYKNLTVSKISTPIKKDSILVFDYKNKPLEVTVTSDVNVNSNTINIKSISQPLPQGSAAIFGASTLILAREIRKGDRSIFVRPLKVPVPKNSILNFGYKDGGGWRRSGVVKTSSAVLENFIEIPIFAYNENPWIPANSIAYVGTAPINSFYMVLESSETYDIESGDDYACDIVSVSADGTVNKICQINQINFTDTWTDVY